MAKIIQKREGCYSPAILKCDCGTEVFLDDGLDNFCDQCGACYNILGQRVLPSNHPCVEEDYWEEEYQY